LVVWIPVLEAQVEVEEAADGAAVEVVDVELCFGLAGLGAFRCVKGGICREGIYGDVAIFAVAVIGR
jgi:hypothetical protein